MKIFQIRKADPVSTGIICETIIEICWIAAIFGCIFFGGCHN